MTTAEPVETVDLRADQLIRDPFGAFADLRERAPLARATVPGVDPVRLAVRYQDVRTVLSDPRFANDVHTVDTADAAGCPAGPARDTDVPAPAHRTDRTPPRAHRETPPRPAPPRGRARRHVRPVRATPGRPTPGRRPVSPTAQPWWRPHPGDRTVDSAAPTGRHRPGTARQSTPPARAPTPHEHRARRKTGHHSCPRDGSTTSPRPPPPPPP
ncbi:hypothetical protein [Kitasatospora sp. NPDC059599]|uniref:hypothetical protein n=1 Tax=Kitasatospora sp. NPDC059599 TaxID=3346880 RepID=UPI00367ECAF6